MKKIELGSSGIQGSEMCLGTVYFGTKTDQKQSDSILNTFLDHGGNFVDTSNNYAFWMENSVGDESENAIGNWITSQQRDKTMTTFSFFYGILPQMKSFNKILGQNAILKWQLWARTPHLAL